MSASLQTWLVVSVNAAGAVAYLQAGWHLANKLLFGVGVAFVMAVVLVGGEPFHQSPAAAACGYAIGFAASVSGFVQLLKACAEHSHQGNG